MNRIIKFSLTFTFVFALILSMFSFQTSAANATIAFSSNTVNVGDSVNVTISVSGDTMTGADLSISYNSEILTYVSGADNGGAGLVKIVDMTMEAIKSKSYTISFKAQKAGSAQISVSGAVSDGIPASDVSVGASATLNVINKELSSNANLKSLRLGVGELSPAFSPDVTTYNILIPNSATKCLVYATTADSDATLVVEGSSTMQVGANKRVVIVTAPNGTQKSYTLNITRSEQPDGDSSVSDVSSSSLSTTLDSSNYVVATDISSVTLFKGFTASTALYNGVDVPVAVDNGGNFKIYYLKSADSDVLVPCTLDNETNTFKKLKYITQGEYTYILTEFPVDKSVSANYYPITAKISDFDIECYAEQSSELTDFYYIYCFVDEHFGVYRYDSREGTIHRFPEFKLLDSAADSEIKELSIIDKFASLPANSKIMVLCLIVAIILAIALIVLLIIKLVQNDKDNFDFDNEDEEIDFENITFDNDFVISPQVDDSDNSLDKNENE